GIASASLLGDLAIHLDRPVEGLPCLVTLGWGDGPGARAPQLLDALRAPQSALARGTDGAAGDDHVYRVGVHLREVTQRQPAAFLDLDLEAEFVRLAVGGDLLAGDDLAVDDQFYLLHPPGLSGVVVGARPVQGARVTAKS